MRVIRFALVPVFALLLSQAPSAYAGTGDDVQASLQHAVKHAEIRGVLLDKLGGDGLRINIDLNGSHVKLTGTVTEKSSQDLAKRVVLSVSGITDVDDQLKVDPDVDRRKAENVKGEINDAVLVSRVKSRLLAEIGTNALKIDVDATDGVINLSGNVPSPEVKKLAVAKAKTTKGVRKVVSSLKSS